MGRSNLIAYLMTVSSLTPSLLAASLIDSEVSNQTSRKTSSHTEPYESTLFLRVRSCSQLSGPILLYIKPQEQLKVPIGLPVFPLAILSVMRHLVMTNCPKCSAALLRQGQGPSPNGLNSLYEVKNSSAVWPRKRIKRMCLIGCCETPVKPE